MDHNNMSHGPDPELADAGISIQQSVEMLKAVIEGETYRAVGVRFTKSRTSVERRIKSVVAQLVKAVGIAGLNDGSMAFVGRLRAHREAILDALKFFRPAILHQPRETRVLARDELVRGIQRVKGRSSRPKHDVALFCILFSTGARPLEIARLEIRDYLHSDGSIRRESSMRAETSISGRPRRLFFATTRLDEALASYLQERLELKLGIGEGPEYRGLDPRSRLFLSASGEGFRITPYGVLGQKRFLCRAVLETFAKLFRYSELKGVTAISARRTVRSRLYERGADEDQIGLLLGISERGAVRELLAKDCRPIEAVICELL
jgi:integrase